MLSQTLDHWQIEALETAEHPGYRVAFSYEVKKDQDGEMRVYFHVFGEVGDEPFDERLDLGKDQAFNFASCMEQILENHQVPLPKDLLLRNRESFDAVFQDIRQKMGIRPGDPIDVSGMIS